MVCSRILSWDSFEFPTGLHKIKFSLNENASKAVGTRFGTRSVVDRCNAQSLPSSVCTTVDTFASFPFVPQSQATSVQILMLSFLLL